LPFFLFLLVAVVLGCGGFYAIWQRYQQPESRTATVNAAPPAETAKPPAPQQPAPQQPQQPAPKPAETAAVQTPATTPSQTPAEASALPTTPVSSVTPPSTNALSLGDGPLEIKIIATEDAWISVTSDGKALVSRILKPGDSRTVRGNTSLRMKTGNAGGLQI